MIREHPITDTSMKTPKPRTLPTTLVPLAGLFVLGWGSNQFAPLLLFFPQIAPIGEVGIQGVFVSYVAALVPMLLLGGWLSDRIGRSRVLLAALVISIVSSGLLLTAGTEPWAILASRVLSGASAGIGFSSATAWATELLPAPRGSRLSMVMMTAGLGTGPLVAGLLSAIVLNTNTPMPQVWVMIPHLGLTIALLAVALRTPPSTRPSNGITRPKGYSNETSLPSHDGRARAGLRDCRFTCLLLPLAPWTLICTALPLATLPGAIRGDGAIDPLLFSAFLTPLPAIGGICVQPLAGNARVSPERLAVIALSIAAAALAISVQAVHAQSLVLLFIACLVFGFAHGFCQTTGLRITASISPSTQLGRNTAIFQALSYLGFLIPLPVALLAQHFPLPTILLAILVLAVCTLAVLLVEAHSAASRQHRTISPKKTKN